MGYTTTKYNVTINGLNIGEEYVYTHNTVEDAKLNSTGYQICRVAGKNALSNYGEDWAYYYKGKECNVRLSNAN